MIKKSGKKSVILDALKFWPGSSRSDLADLTGYRLSTVCGRIHELILANQVKGSGFKWDPLTQRQVEALQIVKRGDD